MLTLFLACGGVLCLSGVVEAALITGLGNLPGGAHSSFAAMSADGSTVVTSDGGVAYRWRAGAWTSLGNPGTDVIVHGVSGDGNVVTGAVPISAGATVYYPRVWRGGSWTNLPLLDNAAIGRGIARTANSDGSVVVGPVRRISNQEATRWVDNAGTYAIDTHNGFGDETNVEDVSANGTTVVGWSVVTGQLGDRAYSLVAGSGTVGIDGPSGPLSPASTEDLRANAISADGIIITGTYRPDDASAWQTWRRVGAGPTSILGPGEGVDVSLSGIIAAGAFIYDAGGVPRSVAQFLSTGGADLTNWTGLVALGVSDNGLTFSGTGLHEYSPGLFASEVWITTIPAPGGVAALAMAGAFCARRRR